MEITQKPQTIYGAKIVHILSNLFWMLDGSISLLGDQEHHCNVFNTFSYSPYSLLSTSSSHQQKWEKAKWTQEGEKSKKEKWWKWEIGIQTAKIFEQMVPEESKQNRLCLVLAKFKKERVKMGGERKREWPYMPGFTGKRRIKNRENTERYGFRTRLASSRTRRRRHKEMESHTISWYRGRSTSSYNDVRG